MSGSIDGVGTMICAQANAQRSPVWSVSVLLLCLGGIWPLGASAEDPYVIKGPGKLTLEFSADVRAQGGARIDLDRTRARAGRSGVADVGYRFQMTARQLVDDRVSARIRAQSARPPEARLLGDGGGVRLLEPRLAEAWLGVDQLLAKSLSVRVGLQDLRYELRRTGEAFFLRLGQSEMASDPRNVLPRSGDLADPQTVAGGLGLRGTWESEWLTQPVYIDAFWLEVLRARSLRSDERIVGLNLDWLLDGPGGLQRTVNAIAAYIDGERDAMTLGLGVDWIASRYWEGYTELYGQFGSRGAFAGRIGLRRTWFHIVSEPYIEASLWYVGQHFLSYENVDTFRILEEDRLGLDIDANYWSARLQSGLSLAPITGGADLQLEVRYGFFRAVSSPRGASSQLGHEIDIELKWAPTERTKLGLGGALLLGAEHFADAAGGRSRAALLWIEATFGF